MYNKMILIGNLTKDGETKFLPSNTEVYKNSIATSHKYKKQDGTTQEEVCFMDFNCFGGQASVCAKYLKKGSKVLLEGRLVFEQWDAQDGSKRSKHALRVDTMKMLDSKPSQDKPQTQYKNEYEVPVQTNLPDIQSDQIPF